jgi:DNA-3-methyladenine glycosylase
MHWMLNAVTEADGFPAAVLIRAILPHEGLTHMRRRRAGRPDHQLTDGPAKLCQALAIDRSFDGHDLCRPGAMLRFEPGVELPPSHVRTGPRVGLNSVPEPWKSLPWRFRIRADQAQELIDEEGLG